MMLPLLKPRAAVLQPGDVAFTSPMAAAQVEQYPRVVGLSLLLMAAALAAAITWASLAQVDITVMAPARLIPDGREQSISSLEGGILKTLRVQEGENVHAGQVVAELDPTRLQAQQLEGRSRRAALLATLARAEAEVEGREPRFPPEVQAEPELMARELEYYRTRSTAVSQSAASARRSAESLRREWRTARALADSGFMSEVEVNRLQRQVNETEASANDRVNRFRQEASAELVRVRSELAQLDEQMVARDDAVQRATLRSPVTGFVKSIVNPNIGGVVTPGAPVIQVVAAGSDVLVELRVNPSDIGFVRVGQSVDMRLSAYDAALYGTLPGKVTVVGPDAIGQADNAAPQPVWYRVLVRVEGDSLNANGKKLPLRAGMQGSAYIRTGKRSVMSYLLQPMLRAHEAFRER